MMEPMSQARVDAPVPTLRLPVVPVTVVVVTRGLSDYLPRTLEALAGQTRPPEQVLLVDAAADATDGPGTLLTELTSRLWPDADVDVSVLAAPGARTMGGAARAALGAVAPHARTQDQGWLWLLHDDSAPEPTALAELLRAVELAPSVALAGCKQRTWSDPVRVLEAGVSTSRFGRRMTGLDDTPASSTRTGSDQVRCLQPARATDGASSTARSSSASAVGSGALSSCSSQSQPWSCVRAWGATAPRAARAAPPIVRAPGAASTDTSTSASGQSREVSSVSRVPGPSVASAAASTSSTCSGGRVWPASASRVRGR